MKPPRTVSRRPARLHVENLEDRTVPALIGLEANDTPVSVTAGLDVGGDIAMKPDGSGFIVAYESADASGGGIFIKQYDANWQLVGGAIPVNTVTANDQEKPSVGIDSSGNFVIAWQSFGQDPGDTNLESGVYARRFVADGSPIDTVEFRVNTTTAGQQRDPDVAVNSAGQFVVVFTSGGKSAADIAAQAFAGIVQGSDGTPTTVGGETTVNDTAESTDAQSMPAVALSDAGSYLVAYQSADQDNPGSGDLGIYARQLSLSGTPITAEFAVNTTVSGAQESPDIAMNVSGAFSIVWDSVNVDGSGTAIVMQSYDPAGVAVGGNVQVNGDITLNDQVNPHIAATPEGPLLVTWEGEEADGDSVGTDVFFRLFQAGGQGLGVDMAASPTTAMNDKIEGNAVGALNSAGDFAILFDSAAGPTADTYLVRFAEAPFVSFNSATSSGTEAINGAIDLRRNGAPYVLANVATSVVVNNAGNGTASVGTDFDNAFSGVAYNFPAGATTTSVPISIVGDTGIEANETINLALGTVINGSVGGPSTATYTIVDDDTPPTVSTGASWSSYGHDVLGSRNNTQEKTLKAKNVGSLARLWTFPGFTLGAPAVVNGVVYATNGNSVVALDQKTGALKWQTTAVTGFMTDSPLVIGNSVVVADWNGDVLAFDVATGLKKWQVHPNTQGGAKQANYGSAIAIGNNIVIGTSSNEEQQGSTTFAANGSVVMLDGATGATIWQTYMIPQAAYAAGWRGVSVWSTPTYDAATNTVYATTGNYFQAGTGPEPGTADATLAMDATTGAIKWVNQLVAGDVWNGNIVPGPDNPDADLADSPKIVQLAKGQKAIAVGSKDGFYFVMDAATGVPINGPDGLQLEVGGVLGGLFATGAVDQKNGAAFSNGLNWPTNLQPNDPGPVGGDLYKVSLDGKKMLWDFKTPSPAASGVAIANGIVYFKTLNGTMYMLNAKAKDAAHALIGTFNVGNGFAAPVVVDGMVFSGGNSGISAYGVVPKAGAIAADVAKFGSSFIAATTALAGGTLSKGQVNQLATSLASSIGVVVKDLATMIGIKAPSTKALAADFKLYANAINVSDVIGAKTALTNLKADLTALFTALTSARTDQANLVIDQAALFASLDALMIDQLNHNFGAAVTDASSGLTNFLHVFDDLVLTSFGISL
jgi:PQQ-like domain